MTEPTPTPPPTPPTGRTPATSTTDQDERMSPEELRTFFLFERLTDEQAQWLADRGRLVSYPAGAVIHVEGTPSTCFLVLLSGTLSMSRRVQGGEIELIRTDYRGAYTGAFAAYLDPAEEGPPQVYPSTGRAVTDCTFWELPAADFGYAVREWFPMAAHLLRGAAVQGGAASDIVNRHERLVALGSVTAGLTHELNNPVAAVMRATARLRERLGDMRNELSLLAKGEIQPSQIEAVSDLVCDSLERRVAGPHMTALQTSDLEDTLADWLDDRGVERAWEMAPTLVGAGLDVAWAEQLAAALPDDRFEVALTYAVGALESDNLLDEIAEAGGRISELLVSAKQYTQMDRAPLQTFDIHEGIDATLTMLGHKLGAGIDVIRDYDRSLPPVAAFPGELNQVWTNLVDNAVDAMDGEGTLTVRTQALDDDKVLVEVGDSGSGMPDAVRSRVFEPFFTTKPIGKGTGLGLDIAWRIVVGRHHGEVRVESQPGDTRFQVVLPLRDPGVRTTNDA